MKGKLYLKVKKKIRKQIEFVLQSTFLKYPVLVKMVS